MKANLTASRLRQVLSYDKKTGLFTWIERPNRRIAIGTTAGSVNRWGYVAIRVDGERYMAHRLAWLWVHGWWPELEIDHINGNRSDNRWANLRTCTAAENRQNQRASRCGNSSGLLGVSWNSRLRRWVSQISVNGKHRYLGLFDTKEAAHTEYVRVKREIHPFGNL